MARQKKQIIEENLNKENDNEEDFSKYLISEINKSVGGAEKEVYDFSDETVEDISVKRWISTGCHLLDYMISNRENGGIPEGRITEIFGPPSIGKSLLGYQLIKSVQKMGGMGFLIDTERATMPEYLEELGINTKNRFMFSPQKQIEKIFQLIDQTISLAANKKKDIPILIVVDSVAAAASKAELEGDYDKTTIGEMARALSKGLKKITEVVGKNGVTLVLLNQTRKNIMIMYGDPDESVGGVALKYYSSVRIKLSGGSSIKEDETKDSMIIGNNVIATTMKNKVASPRRKCEFQIIFGKGTNENDTLFDELRKCGKVIINNKKVTLEGTGGWKYFTVSDNNTGEVLIEKKFYKHQFMELFNTPEYKEYFTALMNAALIKTKSTEQEQQSSVELEE